MRFKSLSIVLFMLLLMLAPLYMMAAPAAAESPTTEGEPDGAGTLTLLHNNDGESSLLPLQNSVMTDTGYPNTMTVELDIGGVAAYKTLVLKHIAEGQKAGSAVLNVYAGDAFLASATLACSLNNPNIQPYDSVAQRQISYDAHIFGNHEFDYSPDFLERFIRGFDDGSGLTQPFLSSNLDFSNEAGFDDLVYMDDVIDSPVSDDRVVAHSLIVTDTMTGQRFGIVGATTPMLPTISSPRDVMVTSATLTDTAPIVQAEIDRLQNDYGVRKIIFVSHLQNVENDEQLIGLLSDVDVAVAGGGDELLANSAISMTTQLQPGERASVDGEYPLEVTDADGETVYVVTTAGNYKYLGRLDVTFDANGEVTAFNAETSYPRRVVPQSDAAMELGLTDTVTMDAGIIETVSTPVEACLEELANWPIASTEILLDVSRNASRGGESNAGNMIADSFVYAYQQYSATSALRAGDTPVIALQNGGGIRQNAGDQLPTAGAPGTISQLDTINVLPFDNFLTVVSDVTPAELKEVLERAASTWCLGPLLANEWSTCDLQL
jgi:5'-nucleotidase